MFIVHTSINIKKKLLYTFNNVIYQLSIMYIQHEYKYYIITFKKY